MNRPKSSHLAVAFAVVALAFLSVLALAPVSGGSDVPQAPLDRAAVAVPYAPDWSATAKPAVLGSRNACSAASSEAAFVVPAAKPVRRGYCRCSCGASCTTSADCGGSPCDRFITCC